ncbi:hypothetical protein [[Clostridium] innocuum]|nr:hypothetical protein [[Clostridium] innocuum]
MERLRILSRIMFIMIFTVIYIYSLYKVVKDIKSWNKGREQLPQRKLALSTQAMALLHAAFAVAALVTWFLWAFEI